MPSALLMKLMSLDSSRSFKKTRAVYANALTHIVRADDGNTLQNINGETPQWNRTIDEKTKRTLIDHMKKLDKAKMMGGSRLYRYLLICEAGETYFV